MNLVLPSENTHTNTQPHLAKSKWVRGKALLLELTDYLVLKRKGLSRGTGSPQGFMAQGVGLG